MKTALFIGLMFISIANSCEKADINSDHQYLAKVEAIDLKCSACILSFPDDSLRIKEIVGTSSENYYHAVNLNIADVNIGHLLKVKIRKARNTEIQECSKDFEHVYVSDFEYYRNFQLNDTLELQYGHCLQDIENKISVCFDSVLTDSRCPVDVVCIWAGEAVARFNFKEKDNSISLDLTAGTMDTLIFGYNFSFTDLLPYPSTEDEIETNEYKAKIVITKK